MDFLIFFFTVKLGEEGGPDAKKTKIKSCNHKKKNIDQKED